MPSVPHAGGLGEPHREGHAHKLEEVNTYSGPVWMPSEIEVSLTMHGVELDPEVVSHLVGSDPDRSHKRGDRGSHEGEPVPRKGYWSISSKAYPSSCAAIDVQIRSLLERVTTDVTVWTQLTSQFQCRVFVGWFLNKANEMIELDPDLLGMLQDRSLSLVFDVYAPDETRRVEGHEFAEGL